MFVAYFDYIHSLQISFVTKGPEDRIRLVKEIQDRIELGDLSFVQNKDTVVISWNVDGLIEDRIEKEKSYTDGVDSVSDA